MTDPVVPSPEAPEKQASSSPGCLVIAALFALMVALLCMFALGALQGWRLTAFLGGLALIVLLSVLAQRKGWDFAVTIAVAAFAALILMLGVCSGVHVQADASPNPRTNSAPGSMRTSTVPLVSNASPST